jgi:hypothetical protein
MLSDCRPKIPSWLLRNCVVAFTECNGAVRVVDVVDEGGKTESAPAVQAERVGTRVGALVVLRLIGDIEVFL